MDTHDNQHHDASLSADGEWFVGGRCVSASAAGRCSMQETHIYRRYQESKKNGYNQSSAEEKHFKQL